MGWPGIRGGKVVPRSVSRLVRHGRSHTFVSNNAGHVLDFNYPWDFVLPLNDLGNGQVDINLARGAGVGTFARATSASCRMYNGLLKKVGNNIPRSHYLSNGVYAGFLAEGARANISLQSEGFENAPWITTGTGTFTPNDAFAPDGTLTAGKLDDTDIATRAAKRQTFVVANDALDHTVSVFVKKKTVADFFGLFLRYTGGGVILDSEIHLNTATGATARSSSTGGGAINFGAEDWKDYWRIWQTLANNASGNLSMEVHLIAQATDTLGGGQLGTPTGHQHIWGCQVEKASFMSSYIPTTVASVPRNTDLLQYLVSGNLDTTVGTIYAEGGVTIFAPDANGGLFGNVNDSNGQLLRFQTSTKFSAFDSTNNPTLNAGPFTPLTIYKTAQSWGGVSFKGTVNGAAIASGTFDGTLGFGPNMQVSGFGSESGHTFVKNLKICKRQISDAELLALTGV